MVEIASQINLPEGTVRRWKCTHKWDNERSDKKNERSRKRKRGAQPKNQNAVGNNGGAPEQHTNAEKFGFFSKYLPGVRLKSPHRLSYLHGSLQYLQLQSLHPAGSV